jgi:hypothetical protein
MALDLRFPTSDLVKHPRSEPNRDLLRTIKLATDNSLRIHPTGDSRFKYLERLPAKGRAGSLARPPARPFPTQHVVLRRDSEDRQGRTGQSNWI